MPFELLLLIQYGIPIGYIILTIWALVQVRRHNVSPREQLIWDVVIIFVPVIGIVLTFVFFPPGRPRV